MTVRIDYSVKKARTIKLYNCAAKVTFGGRQDSWNKISKPFAITSADEEIPQVFEFELPISDDEQSANFSVDCADGIRISKPIIIPEVGT